MGKSQTDKACCQKLQHESRIKLCQINSFLYVLSILWFFLSHLNYQFLDIYSSHHIDSFQYSQCFDFWQLSTDDLHYLTRVHYLAENAPERGTWGEHEIDYILVAQKDVDVTPNPNEVESYTYVSQEQLGHMIGMLFTLFIYQSPQWKCWSPKGITLGFFRYVLHIVYLYFSEDRFAPHFVSLSDSSREPQWKCRSPIGIMMAYFQPEWVLSKYELIIIFFALPKSRKCHKFRVIDL